VVSDEKIEDFRKYCCKQILKNSWICQKCCLRAARKKQLGLEESPLFDQNNNCITDSYNTIDNNDDVFADNNHNANHIDDHNDSGDDGDDSDTSDDDCDSSGDDSGGSGDGDDSQEETRN